MRYLSGAHCLDFSARTLHAGGHAHRWSEQVGGSHRGSLTVRVHAPALASTLAFAHASAFAAAIAGTIAEPLPRSLAHSTPFAAGRNDFAVLRFAVCRPAAA